MEEKVLDVATNSSDEIMVKIENVTKQYKLGMIGGTTLGDELKRFWAKLRKKEDPTRKIGAKNYNKGEKFMALNGVSFEVKKGEAIGLIGHNGAGKSTLLKLITRVTAPTGGKIYLNGRVASMLEVGTGFHGELTGRENIYMNGAILGMTKKEIDAKIEDIIDFSEVRQFIDTPVKRYSSGMFVKLAFSVAAHLDAEIVLMDEVLAVGDMAFQNKCIKKMREIADSGKTIIYVSHNMNTIRALCDRCVVLNKGEVVFQGGVEESIEVYVNVFGVKEQLSITYANQQDHILSDKKCIKIDLIKAEYMHNKINFTNTETINTKLYCKKIKPIDNVCLRVEILQRDREPIGTFVFNNLDILEIDTILYLEFIVPNLLKGKYSVNYTFFQKDIEGNNLDIGCYHGLDFNIVQDETDGLKWNRKYWGNLKFETGKIKIFN